MARMRNARLRWAGGLTAVTTVVALSATAQPAQAAPMGTVLGAGAPGAVSGSYIVTLKGGTNVPSSADKDIAAKYGAKIGHTYGTALHGFSVTVDEQQARRLAADSRVASVVQDTTVRLDHVQQNPPSWGLARIDQPNLPLGRGYTWPEPGGAGVTAYVIDTGIRISHKDFGGRASYGWNFVDDKKDAPTETGTARMWPEP